mgnify:CR=1 FL=1
MAETYIQLVHRLRIHRGPGKADKVSERPREGNRDDGWGAYRDLDKPTLITFESGDQANIVDLLRTGAIAALPAKPEKEVKHGKIR